MVGRLAVSCEKGQRRETRRKLGRSRASLGTLAVSRQSDGPPARSFAAAADRIAVARHIGLPHGRGHCTALQPRKVRIDAQSGRHELSVTCF